MKELNQWLAFTVNVLALAILLASGAWQILLWRRQRRLDRLWGMYEQLLEQAEAAHDRGNQALALDYLQQCCEVLTEMQKA